MRRPFRAWVTFPLVFLPATLVADTFHVSEDGADSEDRDARSLESSWRSLAYACERVPEGDHVIQLESGEFVAKRAARPASGVTIAGRGAFGPERTRLVASRDWKLSPEPCRGQPADEYLIAFEKKERITVRDLALHSEPEHRITGAVFCLRSKAVTIRDVHVRDFRWAGLHLELSSEVEVRGSRIENASTEKCRFHNGLIRTRWLKHSEIHHNEILSTLGGGYGYKGGGHEAVRIHHNFFDVVGGFAIESAHENEFGVEIDHNFANRCISIPKGGQGADPSSRGFEYSFWIHDNLLTDSYTVEGPRNHLLLSDNYIRIEKPNGRVYTHHGGKNHGPVWIRRNIVENVDRAFVWMNRGLAEDIRIENNTVFCAEAGKRAGTLIDSYSAERLNNWVVEKNIFVAPEAEPRRLIQEKRGVPEKMTVRGNICVNLEAVPEGNRVVPEPGLRLAGAKPWPFFAPAREIDAGAYEAGKRRSFGDVPVAVRLEEDAVDPSAGGLPAYRISTPRATYYLEKSGAGLSSLLDASGEDWLGFRPEPGSGAGGEYRGFPNAVHRQGGSYFHARNRATDPAITTVEHAGPHRVTISAASEDGRWACRYDFFPTHCRFTMTRVPKGKKYWVLYEGTPGGSFEEDDWWVTSAVSSPRPMAVKHQGDIPAPEWIAFGDARARRSLLLVNHQDDDSPDSFYAMEGRMTVFGFGRKGLEKYLDSSPASFSIGFVEARDHETIGRVAAKLLKETALR